MVFILEEVVAKTQVSKAIESVISLDYKTLKDLTNPVFDATEIDLTTEMNSTDDHKTINYGRHLDFEEQILSEHFYDSVNYSLVNSGNQSSSARISQVQDEEIYQSKEGSITVSDTVSETLSTEEAREMVIEIQYAAVMGTLSDLSLQKRQQLANWSYFEKAALNYFLATEGVTREVDFSRVV